ncbi:hypothetical protein H4582DRAFT_2063393 [Lactarius indigo]|nr:hypothetical protein H4582DRAFT_2063393 [Lactarius indigo]
MALLTFFILLFGCNSSSVQHCIQYRSQLLSFFQLPRTLKRKSPADSFKGCLSSGLMCPHAGLLDKGGDPVSISATLAEKWTERVHTASATGKCRVEDTPIVPVLAPAPREGHFELTFKHLSLSCQRTNGQIRSRSTCVRLSRIRNYEAAIIHSLTLKDSEGRTRRLFAARETNLDQLTRRQAM